jgi:hypothetical protein
MTPRLVIFSELDGPLHDPPGSAFASAARMLKTVIRANVSLILTSRKTRAELEHVQQGLGIRDPFVSESGAAAFIPPGYFGRDLPGTRPIAGYSAVEFGRTYSDVVAILHRTARNLRVAIQGFSDMSVEDVARSATSHCYAPDWQSCANTTSHSGFSIRIPVRASDCSRRCKPLAFSARASDGITMWGRCSTNMPPSTCCGRSTGAHTTGCSRLPWSTQPPDAIC